MVNIFYIGKTLLVLDCNPLGFDSILVAVSWKLFSSKAPLIIYCPPLLPVTARSIDGLS